MRVMFQKLLQNIEVFGIGRNVLAREQQWLMTLPKIKIETSGGTSIKKTLCEI